MMEMAVANTMEIKDVLILAASLFSAIVIIWAALKAISAYNASVASMYREFNRFVFENMDSVGLLTPYSKASNDNPNAVKIRLYFLGLFNRWWTDLNAGIGSAAMRERHVYFRKSVYGKNINDFVSKIVERGYSNDEAEKSKKVLMDIRKNEPYYNYSEKFWNTYFAGFFD